MCVATQPGRQSRGVIFPPFVCVYVCFPVWLIYQKQMQLGTLNLTKKCSKMSPGNPFITMSKGQRPKSQVTKALPAWDFALLWVLVSSGCAYVNVSIKPLIIWQSRTRLILVYSALAISCGLASYYIKPTALSSKTLPASANDKFRKSNQVQILANEINVSSCVKVIEIYVVEPDRIGWRH